MADQHSNGIVPAIVRRTPPGFLIVVEGAEAGQVVTLERVVFVIGRAPEADLQLSDQAASGVHAVIRTDPDGTASIQDLRSTNGTRVNARLITAPHVLSEGDRISVGACTTLQFTRKPDLVEPAR